MGIEDGLRIVFSQIDAVGWWDSPTSSCRSAAARSGHQQGRTGGSSSARSSGCYNVGVLLLISIAVLAVGGIDGYQAVTGRRVSKSPSRRTDEEMRKQSAIAAVVLFVVGIFGVVLFFVRG